jgi:hypothetical protein
VRINLLSFAIFRNGHKRFCIHVNQVQFSLSREWEG